MDFMLVYTLFIAFVNIFFIIGETYKNEKKQSLTSGLVLVIISNFNLRLVWI